MTDDTSDASSLKRAESGIVPVTVLIVEDDPLVARTIARLVKYAGAEVTIVRRAAEFETLEATYDVGVFDIDLPDGNGVSLARRGLAEHRILQAIFFSGSSNESTHDDARQHGLFISKRAGFSLLIDRVKEVVANKAARVTVKDSPPSGIFRKDD